MPEKDLHWHLKRNVEYMLLLKNVFIESVEYPELEETGKDY